MVLDRPRDRQEPFDRQDDRRRHRGHQRDRLQLVEKVDKCDHLEKKNNFV
jgi:hypothetical protein